MLVSVAILAGGRSRRMGRDKAFLAVGGRSIIEWILMRVEPLTDDLLISTNSPEKYAQFGWRTVTDIYPDKAALGGIYSVIEAARHDHVLVVACDMPFLQVDLLRYMIDLAPTADAVVPLLDFAQPEMLLAVFNQSCSLAIKSRLLSNRLRIADFLGHVTVRYVERSEVARLDPNFLSFVNINTPEDWQKAQAIAEQLSWLESH